MICACLKAGSVGGLNIFDVVRIYPIPTLSCLYKCKRQTVSTYLRPIDGRAARVLVCRNVHALRGAKAHRLGNSGTTNS